MAGKGWNPWRELRRRTHLTLRWAPMRPSKGRIVDQGDGTRLILIDPRLSQVQRSATLSHELIHDELDLLFQPGTCRSIVDHAERIVEAISTDRLVPPDQLRPWAEKFAEIHGGVTSLDVAEEWQVPLDTALLALQRLDPG